MIGVDNRRSQAVKQVSDKRFGVCAESGIDMSTVCGGPW